MAEQRYQVVLAVIAEVRTVTEVAGQWKVRRQALVVSLAPGETCVTFTTKRIWTSRAGGTTARVRQRHLAPCGLRVDLARGATTPAAERAGNGHTAIPRDRDDGEHFQAHFGVAPGSSNARTAQPDDALMLVRTTGEFGVRSRHELRRGR